MVATTITKHILDFSVYLTVGKLLASSLAIEKQLTKAILKDNVIQFYVNTLKSSQGLQARKLCFRYSMWSLKAKVRLKDRSKFIALLNTCAKINIMTKEIIKDVGLAMQHGLKLELLFYTSHSYPFLPFVRMLRYL